MTVDKPILEVWRGLAAIMVVLAHYGPALTWQGPVTSLSFTGVDFFFVISGFVFGPVLFGQSTQNWLAFGVRRATRILPAYWLALAGYVALHWHQHQSTGPWGLHLLFLQLESRETAFALNPAFWSLVPEVQFYMAMPLLVWVIRGSEQRLWLIIIGALSLRIWLSLEADRDAANWAFLMLHQLPGMLIEFLIGTLVWAWSRYCHQRIIPLLCGLSGFLGWSLLALWFHAEGNGIESRTGVAGASLLASIFAASMVFLSLQVRASSAMRICGRWLGGLSYPLYLLHLGPLMVWPHQPALALMASLVIALATHLFFEEPLRAWGRQISQHMNARSKHVR